LSKKKPLKLLLKGFGKPANVHQVVNSPYPLR